MNHFDGSAPAFPCPRYVNTDGETISLAGKHGEDGLTKRELFAAMAMQGLLIGPDFDERTPERISAFSVRYADALISALNESKP